MIDALLEEANTGMMRALTAESDTLQLIAQANVTLCRADQIWRGLPREQRTRLRGFSPQMLGLAADQAIKLGDAHYDHKRALEKHAAARSVLLEAIDKGAALAQQAGAVLKKVCPGEDAPSKAANAKSAFDASDAERSVALEHDLNRLSAAAEHALAVGNGAVKSRSVLYGLDEEYARTLIQASVDLARLCAHATDESEIQRTRNELEHAQAITTLLLRQIGEAFEVANKLDPSFPLLNAPGVNPGARKSAQGSGAYSKVTPAYVRTSTLSDLGRIPGVTVKR
jgi:hypothetical protein